MKAPICSFDAKTGVLCSKCEKKLSAGSITKDDVEAAVKLASIAGKNQDVDKFTLTKGAKVDDDFVLVLRGPDVMTVRSNTSLAEKIEGEFRQKVWYVESEASERRFIEGLFFPSKIRSVNQLYLPYGNKITRAVIAGKRGQKVNVEKIQKIAEAVRGINLLVEFEQQM